MVDDREKTDLDELGIRLAKARGDAPTEQDRSRAEGMGAAFRIGIELVVGVAFGTGLGWFLDKQLETNPWLLIIGFLIGTGAGVRNVFRTARMLNERQQAAASKDSDAKK